MKLRRRAWLATKLVGQYLASLLRSNLVLAREVVTPGSIRVDVVAIPLQSERTRVIAAYANIVSLTPGSLTLDVAEDLRTLYVHVAARDDVDVARRNLLRLQRDLMEVLA